MSCFCKSLTIFFNIWWYFYTFPVIFNPFFNFWVINVLRRLAFTFWREFIGLNVIKTTWEFDFYFTLLINGLIFRIWTKRWASGRNTWFLYLRRKSIQAFLDQLLTIFQVFAFRRIKAVSCRNFNKYLSQLFIVKLAWLNIFVT